MTIKIKCQHPQALIVKDKESVRVRIIKAPVVNTQDLRHIIFSRARALVL